MYNQTLSVRGLVHLSTTLVPDLSPPFFNVSVSKTPRRTFQDPNTYKTRDGLVILLVNLLTLKGTL